MNKKDVIRLLECVGDNCYSKRESNNFYRGQVDALLQVLKMLECEGNSKRAKLINFLDLETAIQVSFDNLPLCLMHHFREREAFYYLSKDNDKICMEFSPDLDEDNCVCYNIDLESVTVFLKENKYKYKRYKDDDGYIRLYINTKE